jgi:PKHD-type hydroxylase
MRGEWSYYKEYFSPEFCDAVISKALEIDPVVPSLGYANGYKDNDFRRSIVRWLDPSDARFTFLFDAYWKIALLLNREWFNFHITDLPPIQFTEYDSEYQGEYKSHQDVFWINPTTRHRKVSIVTQLTNPDEYTGGNLEFDFLPEVPPVDDIRLRGTAIAFPSFIYHKVSPVSAGKRYSLVGWFEGPKFV